MYSLIVPVPWSNEGLSSTYAPTAISCSGADPLVAQPDKVFSGEYAVDIQLEQPRVPGDRVDALRLHILHTDRRERPLVREAVQNFQQRIARDNVPRQLGEIWQEAEHEIDGIMPRSFVSARGTGVLKSLLQCFLRYVAKYSGLRRAVKRGCSPRGRPIVERRRIAGKIKPPVLFEIHQYFRGGLQVAGLLRSIGPWHPHVTMIEQRFEKSSE